MQGSSSAITNLTTLTMKKLAKKEISIGLSVIVAIVILIFGIEFLKGINLFRPANFYMAYYDNVDGLEVSAPVKVNGYKVGQVREINFNYEKPGKTEVVLALNRHLHLPTDSKAIIKASLMGEGYIEIEVGQSDEMIPVGGDVPTVQGGGILDGLSDELMPKITRTLTIVDSLLVNLNTVVGDPALKASVINLEGISNNILSASSGLDQLMNRQMPLLMTSANGIVSNFGQVMYRVDTISGNLVVLTNELNRIPLTQTMEGLNATVNNLEAFSSQLKNQNSTLGKLMNDPELYNRINNVAASVDSLIVDIKRNPKRYISIKLL